MMSVTTSRWFSMSPEVLLEQKLQVDNGLFVTLSAMEGHNFWSKLEEKHRALFLQGFDAVDPGMLYPACRHHHSRVHVNDFYYYRYKGYAFYRDFYTFGCARLLWWLESELDIFYPYEGKANLFVEQLEYSFQDLLEVREIQWRLENWLRDSI